MLQRLAALALALALALGRLRLLLALVALLALRRLFPGALDELLARLGGLALGLGGEAGRARSASRRSSRCSRSADAPPTAMRATNAARRSRRSFMASDNVRSRRNLRAKIPREPRGAVGNTGRVLRSRIWWGLVATALLLRAAVVRVTPGYTPLHDDHSYLIHAVALVNTGNYPMFETHGIEAPTAYRAPGFPVVLALARSVLGTELEGPRLVQVLVATAGVGLVGVVAHRIWGRRTALAATALAALSPLLVVYSGSLISEPLFIALELGALACALEAAWAGGLGRRRGRARRRRRAHPARGPRAAAGPRALRRRPPGGAARGLPRGADDRAMDDPQRRGLPRLRPDQHRGGQHPGRHLQRQVGGRRPVARPAAGRPLPARAGEDDRQRARHRRDPHPAVIHYIADHPLQPLRVAWFNAGRIAGLAPTSFASHSLDTVSLPDTSAPVVRLGLLLMTALALAGVFTRAARRAPPGWWLAAGLVLATTLLVNAEQRFALPVQAFLAPLAVLPFTRGE